MSLPETQAVQEFLMTQDDKAMNRPMRRQPTIKYTLKRSNFLLTYQR